MGWSLLEVVIVKPCLLDSNAYSAVGIVVGLPRFSDVLGLSHFRLVTLSPFGLAASLTHNARLSK